MSTFEIKMPKLGESITEGTIMSWSVKPGDTIREDEILFEVNTAKVNAEVPSPVAGKVIEVLFKEGDTVPVGVVVARVQLEDSEATVLPDEMTAAPTVPMGEAVKADESRWYSPVVLRMAGEANILPAELDQIPGTGYQGRLSKKDLSQYIARGKSQLGTWAEPAIGPVVPSIKTVPSVVNELVAANDGENEVREMDPVGRIIADRMIQSKHLSAHVTTVVEADVTRLVNWRQHQKEAFLKREGINLTYLPMIVEATTKALIDFPLVNASVEGYRMILKKSINIGIAVALDNGNLIVPVIHNTDKMNRIGIAHAIDNLSGKARSNQLKPDDVQGGTFTITNFGSFKNIIGTPIINQPEVAILGVGYIEKKPAVVETPEGDVIAIRSKMYLSLTYDHRIINGSLGGAFVRRIADYLENWES